MKPQKFYCYKKGKIIFFDIFVIPIKVVINGEKSKEQNEISDFEIKSNNDNSEEQENEIMIIIVNHKFYILIKLLIKN